MPGFSSGSESTMYADNVDFSGGVAPAGQITTDGQLLIGSTASPKIKVGTLGSSDASITWTVGSGTITGQVAGGSTVGKTITPNSGGSISPSSGNWNLVTSNSTVTFAGSGSTITQDFGVSNLVLGNTMPAVTTGVTNIGLGYQVLNSATTAEDCIAIGESALLSNQIGFDCIAIGRQALRLNERGENIAIGGQAGSAVTTLGGVVCVGFSSLKNATGSDNTAVGYLTGQAITTGAKNTVFGSDSLNSLTTGSFNTIIGRFSGNEYTSSESSNIIIVGGGTIGESNTLRIGQTGSGDLQQNRCFIAGIANVTVSNQEMVTIDTTTGQMGSEPIPGGGMTWTEVTGTSQNAAVANGYIANNAGLVTITLPASFAVGDIVEIMGKGAGLWSLVANTGDTIHFGNQDTTGGGSLTATNRYDAVRVIGITADTDWAVLSSIGNLTVA